MLLKTTTLNLDVEKHINPEITRNSVFLDIETTGLDPNRSKIVMIGLIYFKDGIYYLEQLFSEKTSEDEVLKKIVKYIQNSKYIVTYNGISFDINFIKKRADLYGLKVPFDDKYLIDLYRIFKGNKKYFSVENFKLKTIEKFIGLERSDSISGKDFIKLYNSFSLNPKKEYLELMLQHNFDDVFNLPFLLENLSVFNNKIDVKYKNNHIHLFLSNNSIIINKGYLKFKLLTYEINSYNTIAEKFNYKIYWNKKNGLLTFNLYINTGKLSNGTLLGYLDLSDIFEEQIQINNNYNVPKNFLVLTVDNKLIEKNVMLFIKLLFDKQMVP